MGFKFLFLGLLTGSIVFAQTKPEAEKKFLLELNQLLTEGKTNTQSYKDSMSIESPFAIDKKGNLSVTARYHGKSGYRLKTEVPVSAIEWVVHDIFIILECAEGTVKMYKSASEKGELVFLDSLKLFHISYAPDESGWLQKIEESLKAIKKYYPKKKQ